jgi:hypothetical protein
LPPSVPRPSVPTLAARHPAGSYSYSNSYSYSYSYLGNVRLESGVEFLRFALPRRTPEANEFEFEFEFELCLPDLM